MSKSDTERDKVEHPSYKRNSIQALPRFEIKGLEEKIEDLNIHSSSKSSTEVNTSESEGSSSYESSEYVYDKRYPPEACLFVASLVSSRTEKQLQESVTEHFKQWGELVNVKVLKDNMNRPYSFVQYKDLESAKRALQESPNTLVDGRHIRVEKARVNRMLFISKIEDSIWNKKDLERTFEKFGDIESFRYIKGSSGGSCFVKFRYREDAIKAFASLKGQGKWLVEWASNQEKVNRNYDFSSIFIGQINKSLTRLEVEDKFKKYGTIQNLVFINRDKFDTAFAFIKYDDQESCIKAIEAEDGKEWKGNELKIQFKECNPINGNISYNRMYHHHYKSFQPPLQINGTPYFFQPYGYPHPHPHPHQLAQNDTNTPPINQDPNQKVHPLKIKGQSGVWVPYPCIVQNQDGSYKQQIECFYTHTQGEYLNNTINNSNIPNSNSTLFPIHNPNIPMFNPPSDIIYHHDMTKHSK